jgi:alpha-ribazole phosphatase
VCYGRSDLPCAETFDTEAAALLPTLPPVDRIVTSPSSRCIRLADTIARARGLAAVVDPRLAEMDFGRWEGVPWDAVPRAELDAWAADFHGARPHGGESVAMLAARVASALSGLGRGGGGGSVAAVTHNGVIRAALAAAGRPGAWDWITPFGGWVEI